MEEKMSRCPQVEPSCTERRACWFMDRRYSRKPGEQKQLWLLPEDLNREFGQTR